MSWLTCIEEQGLDADVVSENLTFRLSDLRIIGSRTERKAPPDVSKGGIFRAHCSRKLKRAQVGTFLDRLIIDSKNSSKNPEMSCEVDMTSDSSQSFSSWR